MSAIAESLPCAEDLFRFDHPRSFRVDEFVEFPGLTIAQEFDLVAPLTIYFTADTRYRPQAFVALNKLRKLQYPLFEELSTAKALALTNTPSELVQRYNALLSALALQERPDAKGYVDEWGAYAFQVGDERRVLAGDFAGIFALYADAAGVRSRMAWAGK